MNSCYDADIRKNADAIVRTTELSFLVELLLDHKLAKATRDLIAERIRMLSDGPQQSIPFVSGTISVNPQAPSTQAAMIRHAAEAPVPVAQVAQTQATVAAMASREQAISDSMNGNVNKVTGRPRKF